MFTPRRNYEQGEFPLVWGRGRGMGCYQYGKRESALGTIILTRKEARLLKLVKIKIT